MRRSIIFCLLIASLIFCSTNVCFANPLDPWSDVETQIVTSGVQDIVSDVDTIRVALSTLYSYLTNNGDGVIEGLLVLANRVSNIINTLDYYLPLQNSVLQNLYSFFVPPSGDTRDIWDLLSQISANTTATSTALNTTNSELLTIDSHIDGIETKLDSINNHEYNIEQYNNAIQSKLTTLNSTEISSLAKLTNIDTNLQSLESINWTSPSVQFSYSNDNVNYYSSLADLTNSDLFYIKTGGGIRNQLLWLNISTYFQFPYVMSSSNKDFFDISFYVGTEQIYPDFYYDFTYGNLNIYIYPSSLFWNPNNIIVKIQCKYSINFISSSSCIVKCLSLDSNDFYIVDNFIQFHKQSENTTLSDIKNILIDIDNNSDFIQNNNDLQINVDIDATDGVAITGVINKLKTLFSTGVGLSQFLLSLNEFDNLLWFTSLETYQQVNYNPNVTGNGYQDLYD